MISIESQTVDLVDNQLNLKIKKPGASKNETQQFGRLFGRDLMWPAGQTDLHTDLVSANDCGTGGSVNPVNRLETRWAFEFYLGLDANETAIEIKDREKEVLDISQRTLEEFTYPEIMAPNTQKRVWARMRDNINEILNQGRVQKVYVKTMLTYRQ